MFNEANSVENFIRDLLCSKPYASQKREVREQASPYVPEWQYIPSTQLKRAETDVLVEQDVRAALIRLNPEISACPDLADEVLYKLRAIILAVRSDGLVRANEEFTTWLRGERTMPFGPNNQHTTVNLIDFANPRNNRLVVSQQVTYRQFRF